MERERCPVPFPDTEQIQPGWASDRRSVHGASDPPAVPRVENSGIKSDAQDRTEPWSAKNCARPQARRCERWIRNLGANLQRIPPCGDFAAAANLEAGMSGLVDRTKMTRTSSTADGRNVHLS